MILDEVVSVLPGDGMGLLGAASFVAEAYLSKRQLLEASTYLKQRLPAFLSLEPTPEEQALAADFEFAAQQASVQLDVGESVLAAICQLRGFVALATGDKRAIRALEKIVGQLPWWHGRVICLEQIVLAIHNSRSPPNLRAIVCASPGIDKALTICFSCASGGTAPEEVVAALKSVIGDLQRAAPTVLS